MQQLHCVRSIQLAIALAIALPQQVDAEPSSKQTHLASLPRDGCAAGLPGVFIAGTISAARVVNAQLGCGEKPPLVELVVEISIL
ncbi:MAG: hypothetical protein ACPIA7_09380 [Akkermansiaceae bacterium]